MKFIGKYGEYLALSRLLENGIEAYPAIKLNQDSYDLTAIPISGKVKRIQVKATVLNNRSTNNTIGTLAKVFDFLVIVVDLGERKADCYVLTYEEAHAIRGLSTSLGVSKLINGVSVVKDELLPFKERWDRIHDA